MTTETNLREIVAAVNAAEGRNSHLLPQVSAVQRICSFNGSHFFAVGGVRYGVVTAFSFHAAVEVLSDGGILVTPARTSSGAEALCFQICDQRRADVAGLEVS